MPRRIDPDDDMPRRRGGAAAAAMESEPRSLALRIVLYSPKDLVAGAIAFAAISAIVANAVFMQAGRHPSPMFGASGAPVTMAVPPVLPRPRPAEAALKPSGLKAPEIRSSELKPADLVAAPVKSAVVVQPAANVARPPAAVPVSSRTDPVADLIVASRRIAAVQRALTEYGYGQLKPTGNVGSDTSAAIQKFERDRKMPVTGQISDRLVRELSTATGRAID